MLPTLPLSNLTFDFVDIFLAGFRQIFPIANAAYIAFPAGHCFQYRLPYEIKEVTTVVKAYSSAVGAGAFVSEIFGEEADESPCGSDCVLIHNLKILSS